LSDSAPSTLNTLNELAAALGDDANFSTTVTNSIATKMPLAGGTFTGNVDFDDNVKARFGASDDLQIYHDGSDSFITHVGTGFVYLQNTTDNADVVIRSDDGSGGIADYFRADGSSGKVLLYHYGTEKLATQTYGIDVTGEVQCDSLDVDGVAQIDGNVTLYGNLSLQDQDKITLGSSADLVIEHTGSGSFIRTSTSATGDLALEAKNGGDLYLTAADDIFLRPQGGEMGIKVIGNGSVELYRNGVKKLETTSTGVTVTGKVTATGFNLSSLAALP
jgi:hypothetical protein